MNPGDVVPVRGCFTQEKFIAGRRLDEIERLLGFHAGRFRTGVAVIALLTLPRKEQFDLGAYTMVPTHRGLKPAGLDIDKLKSNAIATWSVSGFERLVRVQPNTPHDPNLSPEVQYPAGRGVPQWILNTLLQGKVVGIVTDYPGGVYVAADVNRAY
jgi:hypothetical protein